MTLTPPADPLELPDAEVARLRERYVLPFYVPLCEWSGHDLHGAARTAFVKLAATAGFWVTDGDLRLLYSSPNWRDNLCASFFVAVRDDIDMLAWVGWAYDEEYLGYATPWHYLALALRDAYPPLEHVLEHGDEHKRAYALAACAAGGPECATRHEELVGRFPPDLDDRELVARAQAMRALIEDISRGVDAHRAEWAKSLPR